MWLIKRTERDELSTLSHKSVIKIQTGEINGKKIKNIKKIITLPTKGIKFILIVKMQNRRNYHWFWVRVILGKIITVLSSSIIRSAATFLLKRGSALMVHLVWNIKKSIFVILIKIANWLKYLRNSLHKIFPQLKEDWILKNRITNHINLSFQKEKNTPWIEKVSASCQLKIFYELWCIFYTFIGFYNIPYEIIKK